MRKLLLAAALAFVTPALAYSPVICERTWTGEVCYSVMVNPSAKIIHIDPPIEIERFERVDPAPLPRPRPPGLGDAPLDKSRPVIQQ